MTAPECPDCFTCMGALLPFFGEMFMSQYFDFLSMAFDMLFWYLVSLAIILIANMAWNKITKK